MFDSVGVLCLPMLMLLCGCETLAPVDPFEWRQATVRDVMRLADLPLIVDRRCTAQPLDAAHAERLGATVALVAYRVGRLQYLHAFELGADQRPKVGDPVMGQPRACTIRLGAPNPLSAPAS